MKSLECESDRGGFHFELHREDDQWFVEMHHGGGKNFLYVGNNSDSAYAAYDAALKTTETIEFQKRSGR